MMEVLFLKLEDYKRACIVLLSKTGRFILLTERIKIFYLLEASCKRVYRVFQSNQKVFHQASIKKFLFISFIQVSDVLLRRWRRRKNIKIQIKI